MDPMLDLRRWREEVGRSLLNLDFHPEGGHPFRFKMSPILVSDGLRVVQNVHGPGFTFRDRTMVKDGNDSLAIIYPVQGRLSFSQDRGASLRGSDAALLICDRPGQLGGSSSCNYVSIIFQPEDLPPGVDVNRLAHTKWMGTAPALRLLRSYIATLKGTFVAPDSDLAVITHRHILDLVRLAATERAQSETGDMLGATTIGEARTRIAREDIAKFFRDPGLTETLIAGRQGISTRQLQRIFEAAGVTFTEQLQTLRLEAAYTCLTDHDSRSVTEIAFASGFSDVSNFNRQFRRRYGVTPSEVRPGRRRR